MKGAVTRMHCVILCKESSYRLIMPFCETKASRDLRIFSKMWVDEMIKTKMLTCFYSCLFL